MAIDAYTGLPRSGKSYSVVKNVILPSLREGRHVYTNIPLTEALTSEFPEQIHPLASDWFKDMDLCDQFPPGAVVILDELWRRWPSGMKTNMVNFKDKEFLAEHGHNVDEFGNTTRVVLVSQDLSQIAAFARELVAMTYRMTKLDSVGADSRFRVDIYRGAVTGQRPPKSQLTRSVFDKYEADVWKYYKSSTKSQTGEVGNESRADQRANIWKSPWLIASFVAPVVAIPFLLWYIVSLFFGGMGLVDEEIVEVAAPVLVNALPPDLQPRIAQPDIPQAAPVPSGPAESPVWRVGGYIARSKVSANDDGQWRSRLGYGDASERSETAGTMPDVVVLVSEFQGTRYVVASDCERFPDGINWKCTVDGITVTPWSGRGSTSQWASGPQLVGRTAAAASGATEGTSSGQLVNPPPI